MRRSNDYLGEMRPRRMTFRESEALIESLHTDAPQTGLSWDATVGDSSQSLPTRGLSWDASVEVASLLQGLRAGAETPLPDALIERLAIIAVTEAQDVPSRLVPLRSSRWARVRRRIATVGTSLALALGSTAGVAVAANQAVPGDQLYGIDQAMERVGLGAGGSAERLGEALELVQRGDLAEGLQHAAENVTGVSADSNAAQALSDAAERIAAERGVASDEVRAQVAALLQYLADNAGEVDGQVVSQLARDIGNRPDTPPGQTEGAVPPGQDPDRDKGGPPDTPPGQDQDRGGPSDPGSSSATPSGDPQGQDDDGNPPSGQGGNDN